ncbi:Cell adhesion molecule 3, partial [Ophiophagus hannah]
LILSFPLYNPGFPTIRLIDQEGPILEGNNVTLECLISYGDNMLDFTFQKYSKGDDWILPSGSLTLYKVNKEQAGTYTCQAHHPTLPQLTKSKSIRLLVESPKRSFSFESVLSLSTPMLALAVALPAVLLLLLILVFAFLIPRHRAAALKKMALEESGQRTPIYKGSLDSVPSVRGDTQPLVM